eukprot:2488028-Amphidinium_carterae.1
MSALANVGLCGWNSRMYEKCPTRPDSDHGTVPLQTAQSQTERHYAYQLSSEEKKKHKNTKMEQ